MGIDERAERFISSLTARGWTLMPIMNSRTGYLCFTRPSSIYRDGRELQLGVVPRGPDRGVSLYHHERNRGHILADHDETVAIAVAQLYATSTQEIE